LHNKNEKKGGKAYLLLIWPSIELLIISATLGRPGKSGVLSHEPTAIFALNVCEFIWCCVKLTWRCPVENALSASTDVAEIIS
jgi:hypothetical protein